MPQPQSFGRPRPRGRVPAQPPRPQPQRGDRVVLLARDGSRTRQAGRVLETRLVPNPFGGRGEPWARVSWDNGASAWMAIGRSLEVTERASAAAFDPNRDPAWRPVGRR